MWGGRAARPLSKVSPCHAIRNQLVTHRAAGWERVMDNGLGLTCLAFD